MADTKISGMTAATALTGAEVLPVVQSAANVKATTQQVVDAAMTTGLTRQALGSINTNTTIDWSVGSYVTATIGGALTFTFSNPAPTGKACVAYLQLTDGGSAVITWPVSVTWSGGTAPTLRASGVDLLRFYTQDNGTTWFGTAEIDEQQFAASAITSGTIDTARLGSGTANSSTYLRGDQTWATPSGGSANTKWIGAGELIPRVTNGAGIDGEELATNDINLDYLAFDSATSEGAQVAFAWPSGFTTCTATFHWTAASGSGGVRWQASARCYADDDALDQAQGTAQAVSDTLLAANDAHKTAATSAVTPAGTVAAGNLCVVEITRAPSHGDDTLAVDARLIGVMLEFS